MCNKTRLKCPGAQQGLKGFQHLLMGRLCMSSFKQQQTRKE